MLVVTEFVWRRLVCWLMTVLLLVMANPAAAAGYQQVEWPDLIPDDDLKALQNPPENLVAAEEGELGDAIASNLALTLNPDRELSAYEKALTSRNIKPEFNHKKIRIPGFIVPLAFSEQQAVTEFFLVPFFGACMHLPPPPPNQIIYATKQPGVDVNRLMDAFWLEGTLLTQSVENPAATAAYTLMVDKVTPYYDE